MKENVTYTIKCMKCLEGGKTATYWGESARNGFKRGKEHCEGLAQRNEKAPLWRHNSRYHEGSQDSSWYNMKVERSHRTPMSRQIEEGVENLHCKADIVMNAQGEWNGSKLPRLLVERRDKLEVEEGDLSQRMWNLPTQERKGRQIQQEEM